MKKKPLSWTPFAVKITANYLYITYPTTDCLESMPVSLVHLANVKHILVTFIWTPG